MNYSVVSKTLNKYFKGKLVEDGVYDISNIEFFEVAYPAHKNNGKQRVDSKISEDPSKLVEYKGSGFAHGSTNLIDNCPSRVLILQAEKEIYIPKPKNNAYGAPGLVEEYDDDYDDYDDGEI